MNNAGGGLSIVMMTVWTFLIIAGIMAIFIPFWVYRIRNEIIGTNRRLDELIKQAGDNPVPLSSFTLSSKKPVKNCPKCGTANRTEDSSCIDCGGLI